MSDYTHVIYIGGCDDSTAVTATLCPDQLAAVRKIAEDSARIGGGCKPTIEVHAAEDVPTYVVWQLQWQSEDE